MAYHRLTAEDHETITTMTQRGRSLKEIAREIGCTDRTVSRVRADLGLSSQWARRLHPCGTVAAYQRGCRCERCTEANTEQCRADRHKARARHRETSVT